MTPVCMKRSAPTRDSAYERDIVDIIEKPVEAKIKKEMARVNMIDVLLFLELWPCMFFRITE